jgi:hypothetical protein
LDLDGDPTPGSPMDIRDLATRFLGLAADASSAAGRFRQAAGDEAVASWVGLSGDAYRAEIGGFPGDLDKLSTSYGMAGRALNVFASQLDGAQAQADSALARGREARAHLTSAQAGLTNATTAEASSTQALATARHPRTVAAPVPAGAGATAPAPDPAAVTAAVRNHTAAATRMTQAQAAVTSAQADVAAARRLALAAGGLRQDAEASAAHEIHAASHAGIHNKKWWQKLGSALAAGWHVLVDVAKVVVLVLGIVALIIGGPLAWVVFAAALIVLADTLAKYAQGKASLWDVALAALACIPMTKGLTSLGEISTALREGEGLLGVGRLVATGARGQLADMISGVRGLGRGLTTVVKGLPNALADSLRVVEIAGADGAHMVAGDSGPLRDLFAAAMADARGGGGAIRPWPTDTSGYAIQQRDLDFLGITREQVDWWRTGQAPLGMTPTQYREYTSTMLDTLKAEGLDVNAVDVRMQGSGANFFSGTHKALATEGDPANAPGVDAKLHEWFGDDPNRPVRRPFDSHYTIGADAEPSDFDMNFSSDAMYTRAQAVYDANPSKFDYFVNPDTHGYVNKEVAKAAFPQLRTWAKQWGTDLGGRDVSWAIFPGGGPLDTSATGISVHFQDSDWVVHNTEKP